MHILIYEYACAGGAGSRRASSGAAEFQKCVTQHTFTHVCLFLYVNMYVQVVLEVDEQAVDQLSFESVLHITHLHICMSIFLYVNMYVQVVLEIEEQAVDQLSFKSVLHNTHLHIFMSMCIFEYVFAGGAGSRRASSGSAEFQERATQHAFTHMYVHVYI